VLDERAREDEPRRHRARKRDGTAERRAQRLRLGERKEDASPDAGLGRQRLCAGDHPPQLGDSDIGGRGDRADADGEQRSSPRSFTEMQMYATSSPTS